MVLNLEDKSINLYLLENTNYFSTSFNGGKAHKF